MIGLGLKAKWLALLCLYFGITHQAIACVSYDEWVGDVSSDWNNANNWEGNTFPTTTQAARIDPDNYINAPVVSGNSSFTPRYLVIQDNATMTIQANVEAYRNTIVSSGANVTVSGGTWTINSGYDLEILDDNTTVTVSGGAISAARDIVISGENAFGADPVLTISSGTISVGRDILFSNSANDQPTMNINGGTVNVADDVIRSGGNANVNMTAGTLNITDALGFTNASDDFTMSGGAINIGGDWTLNGSSAITGGTVTFNGTGGQDINNNGGETFHNLVIDNSSAAGVTLNDAVTVNNTLILDEGIVHSSATDILIIGDNTTVSGASDVSYVDGWVRKVGNDVFTFPVGADDRYRPIFISAPGSASDAFSATYNFSSPNGMFAIINHAVALSHVSALEYWQLQRDAGASNVSVGLSWDTLSGNIGSLTDMRIARWNGAQWDDTGNGGTTGDTNSGTVVTALPMSGFGAFTLSSASFSNVLPVTWLDFTTQAGDGYIRLEWITATERLNDRFEVERSRDMITFEKIGEVETRAGSDGNSNRKLVYDFIDDRPEAGYNYYRLKQVDMNNSYDFSKTVAERIQGPIPTWEVTCLPDLASGNLTVRVPGEEVAVDISLYDITGAKVHAARYATPGGAVLIPVSSQWASGVYLLHVQSASEPAHTSVSKVILPRR